MAATLPASAPIGSRWRPCSASSRRKNSSAAQDAAESAAHDRPATRVAQRAAERPADGAEPCAAGWRFTLRCARGPGLCQWSARMCRVGRAFLQLLVRRLGVDRDVVLALHRAVALDLGALLRRDRTDAGRWR